MSHPQNVTLNNNKTPKEGKRSLPIFQLWLTLIPSPIECKRAQNWQPNDNN